MARILRGEIWWANLEPVIGNEQAGTRPVLIISHDVFNERSGTVIALAITSQKSKAGFPLTLELLSANRLTRVHAGGERAALRGWLLCQ
jgi:mRNA interferase MazF